MSSFNGTEVTLLTNLTFIDNVANIGGAISLLQSNLTTGTSTDGSSDDDDDTSNITTPTAIFQHNSASEGGAIDISEGTISIEGIRFQSNIASERVRNL